MISRPFVRRRGRLHMQVTQAESELLRSVLEHLRSMIDLEEAPEELRRLFPPAYTDDLAAEAEFERYTRDELRDAKRVAIAAALACLDRGREKKGHVAIDLAEEDEGAWLGVLNDLRLFLGTRLDVSDDMYSEPPEPSDPKAPAMELYLYLGWLEESLVEVLLD